MEIKEVQKYLERETNMNYEKVINVLTHCLNDSRYLEELKKEILKYSK